MGVSTYLTNEFSTGNGWTKYGRYGQSTRPKRKAKLVSCFLFFFVFLAASCCLCEGIKDFLSPSTINSKVQKMTYLRLSARSSTKTRCLGSLRSLSKGKNKMTQWPPWPTVRGYHSPTASGYSSSSSGTSQIQGASTALMRRVSEKHYKSQKIKEEYMSTYRRITIHKLGQQPLQLLLLRQRSVLLARQPHDLQPLLPLLLGADQSLGTAIMDGPEKCLQGLSEGLGAGSGPMIGFMRLVRINAATFLMLIMYWGMDLHAGPNYAELSSRSRGRVSLTHCIVRELQILSPLVVLTKAQTCALDQFQ